MTNQFSIDGKSTRRPDIVLLINGIPIVVIEAKTANRPVAQQLALKVKARNPAITDALAAEIAAATLTEADKHCFPGWWGSSTVDPELSRGLLFLVATRFSSAGLLTDDAMGFIGSLVEVLKRRHYKPSTAAAVGDDGA